MRSILILLFLILFMLIIPVLSAEEVTLEEIYNPSSIKVDDQNIYIVQDVNIFVYSVKNFKLIKKFGKAGEGPGEFKKSPAPWIPSITLYVNKDKILINSIGKVFFFTKDGNFIKEQRTTDVSFFGRYIPCGKNYILMKYLRGEKDTFVVSSLVDSNLKSIKEIFRIKFPAQRGKKRNPILMAKMATYFDRYSYNDKFVIPTENGTIKIFDQTGKELKSFTPEYTKQKITSLQEKKLDDFFTNHKFYKEPYLADKNRNLITFGDHLPIFNYYRLANDKIYIFSSFKKDGKYETFIYNFDGILIKKTLLFLENLDIFNVYPFDIKNSKIYQLVYNEDEEEMKLIIKKI